MSDSERHIPHDVTYVWNLLRKIELIDTENRLVVARRWGLSKMGRGSQKAQTHKYMISKYQGCNVEYDIVNTILCYI